MGNRKQPFGYRVVMGEIALHPQESKLVEPMTALDAELLQSSVSAIHCHNDGSLNIKLKNGQVIGKE